MSVFLFPREEPDRILRINLEYGVFYFQVNQWVILSVIFVVNVYL
ncbi:hypothetical protein VCR14J2_240177 [Vibrio coralliirubri]|nr:hypothetical protein VCR6J2_220107 [Vibrio coralliirubri]CDT17132.1 hypothetical protein VCR4J2_260072 [Vibrio coralliirubri]CDT22874.1 hypothetical protein VCR1J2_220306 [Vibrio coralliirubri]CDT41804.1 hypothetical protein VCR26J2_150227 [Vibrio coralliirubri]CDT87397.1 hypothetical protein VCR8J2_250133 [Vibrio coralliirubri]